MRGVDRGDQMIALYNSRRKSVKVCLSVCLCPSSVVENNYMILSQAWKSMLWYMLECAILNAFIIEGHFDQRHHPQHGTRRDYMAFRIDLANRLIDGFTQRKANPRKDHSIERLNPALNHFPATGPTVRCYLCQRRKIRHETVFMCTYCEVPLCIHKNRSCFVDFHTKRIL
jgi:hypothetical protein